MRTFFVLLLCVFLAACSRPATEYLARGQSQLKSGKAAEAVISFRKAIKTDPQLSEAYVGLGMAYYQTNDLANAYQALSRAVEMVPNHEEATIKLAEVAMGALLVDMRRPEHLKTQLHGLADRLLKKNPKSPDGLKMKGLLAAVEKKHDEALGYFQTANATGPLNVGLKLLEIEALMNTGRETEGEAATRALIQNRPDYGPAYDLLISHYLPEKRLKETEELLLQKVQANPKNVSYQLQLARFYTQLGSPDMAESAVSSVLSMQPEEDAFMRVADFYVETGQPDKALPLYRQGMNKSQPVRVKCLVRIASVLGAQRKFDEALVVVRDARKISMQDEPAVRLEADLLLQTGKPENLDLATRIYREALIRKPTDPFVRYNLSRALAAKGDMKGAQQELEQCIRITPTHLAATTALASIYRTVGEPRDLLNLADKVLAEDPNNVGAQLLRSEGLLRTGRPANARTVLLPLQQHPAVGKEAGLLLARAFLAEKTFDRAEAEFRKHYVPGQVDLRAIQGLSDVLLLQTRMPAVVGLWEQELRLAPDSVPVKRGLARAMYLSQRYDRAVSLYKEIGSAAPTDVESQVYLAASLLGTGQKAEGIEVFKKASDMPAANSNLIDEIIGYLYQFEGNGPIADTYHRKVIARDPKNGSALNNLAYSLASRNENLEEAVSLATKATQLQPENPEFADTLAYAMLQSGEKQAAQTRLEALVLRFPQHPGFRYHHALALMQVGKADVAKRELTFALPRAGSPELAKKISLALTSVSKGS